MNGIHDMGGITSFGPVVVEENEPVFHDDWEKRVFSVMFLSGLGPIDASRHAIERMDPVHYLETTYYEHWLKALEALVIDKGLLAESEIQARHEAWDRAHRATPHGEPVDLETAARNA